MKDTKTIPITVTVKHEIPVKRVKDMLCCAIEGGSNYWCDSMDRMGGITQEQARWRQDVPFVKGGWLEVIEWEPGMSAGADTVALRYKKNFKGKEYECYRLDFEAITKGLQIFAEKYPSAFAELLTENDDAATGDTFLQCCLFGEAIYG